MLCRVIVGVENSCELIKMEINVQCKYLFSVNFLSLLALKENINITVSINNNKTIDPPAYLINQKVDV